MLCIYIIIGYNIQMYNDFQEVKINTHMSLQQIFTFLLVNINARTVSININIYFPDYTVEDRP